MLRCKGFFSGVPRKNLWLSAVMAAAPALLAGAAWAQTTPAEAPVMFQASIPVPVASGNTTGGMFSWDITWVDQTTQTGYIADRSNKAVDVFDAKTDTFVKQITASPPFAGVSTKGPDFSGPNGVLTTSTCIVATDTPSRVVSFTLAGSQVGNLSLGGTTGGRSDELAFDPKDNLLLVINPAESPPFGTLVAIGPKCGMVVEKQISLTPAEGGAEQPVWDPGTQRFFLNIPNTSTTVPQQGALERIDPIAGTIDAVYAVFSCSPTGLALNPTNKTLLLGCGTLFDTAGNPWKGIDTNTAAPIQQIWGTNGFLQAIIPGVGVGDEVWYNSGDDHFYTGDSGSPLAPSVIVTAGTPPAPVPAVEQGAAVLGVIDGTSQRLDQLVPTFNVAAVAGKHPGGTAHSVAANAANNQVFVPLAGNNVYPGCQTGCVAIYARSDVDLAGAND